MNPVDYSLIRKIPMSAEEADELYCTFKIYMNMIRYSKLGIRDYQSNIHLLQSEIVDMIDKYTQRG